MRERTWAQIAADGGKEAHYANVGGESILWIPQFDTTQVEPTRSERGATSLWWRLLSSTVGGLGGSLLWNPSFRLFLWSSYDVIVYRGHPEMDAPYHEASIAIRVPTVVGIIPTKVFKVGKPWGFPSFPTVFQLFSNFYWRFSKFSNFFTGFRDFKALCIIPKSFKTCKKLENLENLQ